MPEGFLSAAIVPLIMVILAVTAFIFWIMMIVDCAKREFPDPNQKIIWIVVIALLQIIGAIAYWLSIYKKPKA
jgi:uncharacterized membrane protein YphA (DoxX/SURF4 family)